MQQATLAPIESSLAAGREGAPATTPKNAFVINLVSSTTPVVLRRPDHAGLKRFTFFVSRRLDAGRERFRLHMGFFQTQEEAEKLLDIVREIYPGAWAGLAPGRSLRPEARGALLSTPGEQPTAQPVIAPPTQSAPQAPGRELAASAAEPAVTARSSASGAVLTLVPDVPRRRLAELPEEAERHSAAHSLSSINATIASLDERAANAPVLRPIPELKAAVTSSPSSSRASAAAPARAVAAKSVVLSPEAAPGAARAVAAGPGVARPAAPASAPPGQELSDTGALRMLESAKSATAPAVPVATVAVARAPAPGEERPHFAVQLVWSVQPIDMARVPQLAIFSAYTLYRAEGNRDGRRWYGVRLGFFTDAVSAKQVAHYVRADFATVSVVPVTLREREHAKLAASRPNGSAKPASAAAASVTTEAGFEFIDDSGSMRAKVAKKVRAGSAARGASAGESPAKREPPGKRAKLRVGSQIHARRKAKSMTLEQTLEILGAGELKVDAEEGALSSDLSVPGLGGAKAKPSKLSRLFERLSERLGSN